MGNREYINCKNQMKKAWLNTGAGVLIIEQPIKGLKQKSVWYRRICMFKLWAC